MTIPDRAALARALGMQGRVLPQQGRDRALIQYDHQKDNPDIGQRPTVHTLRMDRWRMSRIVGVAWRELYPRWADPDAFELCGHRPTIPRSAPT